MNKVAFDTAVENFGGATKLAQALEETPQVVSNWRAREAIPANKCKTVAALLGLSVRDLRDDWAKYWPEPDQATTPGAFKDEAEVPQ